MTKTKVYVAGDKEYANWLPNTETVDKLEEADVLMLTGDRGGTDVTPRLYGQPYHRTTDKSDLARDLEELGLVAKALERGIPLLGICRGLN